MIKQVVEPLLEAECCPVIDVHKLHGESVPAPRVKRFGRERHPANPRQIDLHAEPDAPALLVARVDEASAPAQIENAERGFEHVHSEPIERARETLVSPTLTVVDCGCRPILDDLHACCP